MSDQFVAKLKLQRGSGFLERVSRRGLTPRDAIATYTEAIGESGTKADEAMVVSWSARRVRVETVAQITSDVSFDQRGVFEIRAFCPTAELRWFHEDAGLGRAVIVREGNADVPHVTPFSSRVEGVRYLLFGQVETALEGVSELTAERIGSLSVPGEFRPKSRVAIRAVEYLAPGPGGNAVVVDERLIEFEEEGNGDD